MGFAMTGMSGQTPLTFTEIYSYMRATNTALSPKEVLTIRNMSSAYVGESYNDNPLAAPPYVSEEMAKPKDNGNSILEAFKVFA